MNKNLSMKKYNLKFSVLIIILTIETILKYYYGLSFWWLWLIIRLIIIVEFIKILYHLFKQKKLEKIEMISLFISISLVVLVQIKKNVETNKERYKSGYSDGVISGAEIFFYKNGEFQYCSDNLIYQQCYKGKYNKNENLFELNYFKGLPRLRTNLVKESEKNLIFLLEDGSEYKFTKIE